MSEEYVFDAFISYSHRDLAWGRWLQKKLEGYSVPREAARERQESRKLRIFRDQTDLAGAELQSSLNREMKRSRFLIVICSPASASSKWVNEEIRYFMSLGRADRIIPFIVSGEPFSESPETECFPPALKEKEGDELLGTNVQEIGKNKAFLKVASILLDIRFNRLVDRAKKRRLTIGLSAGSAALAVVSVVAALAVSNYNIRENNRNLAFLRNAQTIANYKAKDGSLEPDDVMHLESSANAGDTDAMVLLADCYRRGLGTETDENKAFQLYLQAASAEDDIGAIRATAGCYYDGVGTDQNYDEAFKWYMKAAQLNDVDSMKDVADCYMKGYGTEADPQKAVEWYTRAAEEGSDITALFQLSVCYQNAIGVERNEEKAFQIQKRLAEMGIPPCMRNTGQMYQFAIGTEENPREAYLWYRKGAEAGDEYAMYGLAWCIENHYGVENVALEWYQRAVEAGNKEAAADVERILAQQETGAP